MPKIKAFFISFSFRMGVVIFSTLCALLIGQHLLVYQQAIDAALEDTRQIIDAHDEDIDEAIDRLDTAAIKTMLQGFSENFHDKHLYILLKDGNHIQGNAKAWPPLAFNAQGYAETTLQQADGTPVHVLASVSDYPGDLHLLIAYDLERVDQLRHHLPQALFENLMLAFTVSLLASIVIIGLLARHFRHFNNACNAVMTGSLDSRVRTRGADDVFDALAHNINRMLDWNGALINTIKDSSNAIAHDMRTPLSRIRLALKMLAEEPDIGAATKEKLLAQVERIDSLMQMFDSILNIAQAESRLSAELFTKIDITQLARDILDFYAPVFEEKNLHLASNIPETALFIKGDKSLLGQAMANLLDNACKYTPAGGTLAVTIEKNAAHVTFSITDSGEGIPEALHEKVTERFFRVDTSRHDTGHGLGLSLVKAVATLHHGQLVLSDNHPGLKAALVLQV